MSASIQPSIFISHSSRDAELAKAVADLFRVALKLSARQIRCTSAAGYKLDVGANTNEQLRLETVESTVLIGLITEVSIESAYVLFELGARWGANKFLAPLTGAGRGPEILAGPLSAINALTCAREDLLQLVANVAAQLDVTPESADSYSTLVDNVAAVSAELAGQRGLQALNEEATSRHFSERNATLTAFQCNYLMDMSRPRNEGFIYSGLMKSRGRDAAEYQEAMETLLKLSLVNYDDGYRLTSRGWKVADLLWQYDILDALANNDPTEDQLAQAVNLTDGESEQKELRRHLSELANMGFVKVDKTMHSWSVTLLPAGDGHRKQRSISID